MTGVRVYEIDDPGWDDAVEACTFHDAYHHADYHRAMVDHGRPVLVAGGATAPTRWAMPLVLRPISEVVPGCAGFDAISVYGFTGLAWCPEHRTDYAWAEVWEAVREHLALLDVVSVFVRLHPFDPMDGPWPASAEVVLGGQTVVCTPLSMDGNMTEYRKVHRYDVRRALKDGLEVRWSSDGTTLAEFVLMYEETMLRNAAHESYFFDRQHLQRLFSSHHFATYAGAVEVSGRTLAMSLFLAHPPYAHYFLSGAPRTEHGSRPSKLLIHEARKRLAVAGCTSLHLGGGVGSREDPLFQFKSGFSQQRASFRSLRWVLGS